MLSLVPLIIPTDPMPPEFILEADTAAHRAGDLMMQTSAISLGARKTVSIGPQYLPALEAVAEESRLLAASCVRMAEIIRSLQARAAS